MKRLLIFPLFLALVYSIENTSLPLIDYDYEEQEVTCECNNAQLLKTADFTLREDVKNVQIRLIEPVRNTIAFAMSEKAHLLAVTKYAVLRDIDKNHPNLLRCSNFSNSFDDFMDAVKKIMNSENNLSLLTIQNEVNDSVDAFFREILPSAFLSLYSPRCRRVTEEYKACMNNNTDEWKGYFGEHPNRMATLISDTVFRYRKLEFIVSDMHDQLMNAPNLTVTSECADAYSKLVPCNCTFPGITNCNNSCPDIMETCFGKFTREWGGRLFLLQNMTRGHSENLFVNQFLKAKKSMGKSLDFLVERQVPFYAAHIVEHCGTPGDLWLLNKNPKINLVAPQRFTSQGEAAAKELQQSIKTWEKLSQQICEQHNSIAQPSYCWNGTNVICVSWHGLTATWLGEWKRMSSYGGTISFMHCLRK